MILLPDWPDFPWDEVVEEDLGYDTECWIWTRPLPPTSRSVTVRKQVKRLFNAAVGARDLGAGECWMHLCERYGEINYCVRPDHITIGTRSQNMAHHHALRRAAGVKHSSTLSGKPRDPELVAKTAAALRGRPKSLEHRAVIKAVHDRQRENGPYVCAGCGKEFILPAQCTRHIRYQCSERT